MAALLLGVIGVGSTAGRFFLGAIADRMRPRALAADDVRRHGVSLAIWVPSANVWSLAVFAFVYGAFYGGWVALLAAVVMDYFGGRKFSGIIGVLYTGVAFGTLIGPKRRGIRLRSQPQLRDAGRRERRDQCPGRPRRGVDATRGIAPRKTPVPRLTGTVIQAKLTNAGRDHSALWRGCEDSIEAPPNAVSESQRAEVTVRQHGASELGPRTDVRSQSPQAN